MGILTELWGNMMHSTPQAFLGVPAIFIYFSIIVVTAAYRIRKADHMDH